MNEGAILNSLRDAKKILKDVDLLSDFNKSRPQNLSVSKFSEEFLKISQKNDYEKIFRIAMENSDYDFILVDDSIFQFSCKISEGSLNKGSIRYAYYESPRNIMSYEEFLKENELLLEEDDGAFVDYYEQYKSEASLKSMVTPIRYDYDYVHFTPVHHPISHLHIGHNNQVRIPLNKIISPAKFVIFVLRNVYNKQWKKSYEDESFKEFCLSIKNSSSDLDISFFNEEEGRLLYLS